MRFGLQGFTLFGLVVYPLLSDILSPHFILNYCHCMFLNNKNHYGLSRGVGGGPYQKGNFMDLLYNT